MSFDDWPDLEAQWPAALEHFVPTPASEISAETLSQARLASGLVSAVASRFGLRLEARAPPQQVHELQATFMDQNLWAETLNVQSNAQPLGADGADDGDDMQHRSMLDIGF